MRMQLVRVSVGPTSKLHGTPFKTCSTCQAISPKKALDPDTPQPHLEKVKYTIPTPHIRAYGEKDKVNFHLGARTDWCPV